MEKAMLQANEDAAKAADDPKQASKMLYGCNAHPCNGKTFVCEIVPTNCHNCGGTTIEFLRYL